MKAWLLSGLLVFVAFAGCSGDDPPGPEGSSDSVAPSPTNDENTASIDGLVLDEELVVIAGATIGIRLAGAGGPYEETRSDADGRFSYSFLAPGTYEILVKKFGYLDAKEERALEANQLPYTVSITLVANVGIQPHKVLLSDRGIFGCGFYTRGPVFGFLWLAACGVAGLVPVDLSAYDRFLIIWNIENQPVQALNASVFEMNWESTQTAGRGLTMTWEKNGCSNAGNGAGSAATFSEIGGSAPLREYVTTEQMQAVVNYGGCGASVCSGMICSIQSRVAPYSDTLGSSAPVDVGVTFQQPYDIYLSLFYNEPAPLDFTQLPPT